MKPLRFSDILIAPYEGLLGRSAEGGPMMVMHQGGPIWPDWDSQVAARHCRDGQPVDLCPAPPAEFDDMPRAHWGGPIHGHFGHMLAEFGMRLMPTVFGGLRAPIVFYGFPPRLYARRKHPLGAAPQVFRDMIAYAGLRPPQVRVRTRGLKVGTLFVAPQAEQLGQVGPSAAYLDLLGEHAEKMLGQRQRKGAVFVSRAGQFSRFAGEAYLEAAMASAGVRVIRPEALPLVAQLEIYRNAALVIFSEGSAMHTPQLLGRDLADVVVLNRRPGRGGLNAASLAPRSASLTYRRDLRDVVAAEDEAGRAMVESGLPLLDAPALLAGLAEAGVDLAGHWDKAAFERAEIVDIEAWLSDLRARVNPVWTSAATRARIQRVLARHFGARFDGPCAQGPS